MSVTNEVSKKRRGRRALPLDKRRGSFTIRISPEERALLDAAAARAGEDGVTQWARTELIAAAARLAGTGG